jgi:post-segregation antitoxin (ccd killing protein)
MNEFSSRHYDNYEINRIIRRALKLKNEDTISHQDLIDTARDIGLDSQIVETAIEQEQQATKKEKIMIDSVSLI